MVWRGGSTQSKVGLRNNPNRTSNGTDAPCELIDFSPLHRKTGWKDRRLSVFSNIDRNCQLNIKEKRQSTFGNLALQAEIGGHTDSHGDAANDLRLSQAIELVGIGAENLKTVRTTTD
jgi:hypothetical protein